jgi:hypothetical protein
VTPVDALFEEFVSRWVREEPIDVDGLLERAGSETDELARLIDTFLERAPRREPSPESKAAIATLAAGLQQEPPLLTARVAARRRVRDVVSAIVAACSLPAEAEQLVRSYYQRLEGGLLDPKGVSDRVWSVLEKLVGPEARARASEAYAQKPERFGALAFQRLASGDPAVPSAQAAPPPGDEIPAGVRRQVDELFTAH